MRSSTVLFQAVLFALAAASPRPGNADSGNPVVARNEPGLLVARANDLSPELAQKVADNGITPSCSSSTTQPAIPAKMRKRQDEVAEAFCPAYDPSICKAGFKPLCCEEDSLSDVVGATPAGLIYGGCQLSASFRILGHSCN